MVGWLVGWLVFLPKCSSFRVASLLTPAPCCAPDQVHPLRLAIGGLSGYLAPFSQLFLHTSGPCALTGLPLWPKPATVLTPVPAHPSSSLHPPPPALPGSQLPLQAGIDPLYPLIVELTWPELVSVWWWKYSVGLAVAQVCARRSTLVHSSNSARKYLFCLLLPCP